jgi:uncharacterized repeat protein (TIGR01451 family)
MPVRRIQIATVALGLVGIFGFTVVQVAAQPSLAPPPKLGADPVVIPPRIPGKNSGPALPTTPVAPATGIVLPPTSGPSLPTAVKTDDAPPIIMPPAAVPTSADGPAPPTDPMPAVSAPKPGRDKFATAESPVDSVPPTSPPDAPTAPAPPNRVTPAVSLETIVPDAVLLGKDISYEIIVRNNGVVPVTGLKVEDEVPNGSRYLTGEPPADVSLNTLRWSLGDLPAGMEKKIRVTVKPGGDGDFKTTPRVTYTAATASTVKITRPKLTASVTGPDSVLINDEAAFTIQVKNDGSGPATRVKIHVALPSGLRHPQQREGSPVEAELPILAPGETKSVVLRTKAVVPGPQTCVLTVMADMCSAITAQATATVQKPALEARLSGPGKAMVRGEPTFTLEVSNPGNATTPNVQAAVSFPEGLDFVSASDSGNYEPGSRTITWNLGSQPAGSKKALTFKLRAGFAGTIEVRAVAAAPVKVDDKPLDTRCLAQLQVEGVPAVAFEVVNLDNPAEVGKEVTYEIRVVNQGTCPLANVKLLTALSEGLAVVSVTGPTKHTQSGQTVTFDAIPRLAVKADVVVRVKAKGMTAGDLRCKVQLSCDNLKQPLVKEESTVFYAP